jgi:hypothetical protein
MVFISEPVKLNSKIADSCAVLAMEIETEDTLGVKFSKGVCPEERVLVRVEESWVHVERKPKLVVRCWGAGYMGPRRVKGLEDDGENAMLFVKSAKFCRVAENSIVVIKQAEKVKRKRAS